MSAKLGIENTIDEKIDSVEQTLSWLSENVWSVNDIDTRNTIIELQTCISDLLQVIKEIR